MHLSRSVADELYTRKRYSTRRIAQECGMSPSTVVRRLHQFGIPVRPTGPKRHLRLRSKTWLTRQYVELGKSTVQIAEEIGASARVIWGWLDRHGIKCRPRGGSLKGKRMPKKGRRRISAMKRGRMKGPDNPNWKGGYVDPTYSERRSYKAKRWTAAVKKRDGYKCVHCGASECRLHAHHVKSWRGYPSLRFDVSNGITLCEPCHQRAHGFTFDVYKREGKTDTSAEHSATE